MSDRYRLFSLILYEDTDTYDIKNVLFNIRSNKYYAYILHNQDKDNKGNFKKPHYHIIIKLDNATTIDALSKKLGVPKNYIQNIRNERAYIRYLIHFDDADKFQYELGDIKNSRLYERYIKKCFEDKETEEEIIVKINAFINNLKDKNISNTDALFLLIQFINSNNYDQLYKRYRFEFQKMLNLSL